MPKSFQFPISYVYFPTLWFKLMQILSLSCALTMTQMLICILRPKSSKSIFLTSPGVVCEEATFLCFFSLGSLLWVRLLVAAGGGPAEGLLLNTHTVGLYLWLHNIFSNPCSCIVWSLKKTNVLC